MAITMHSLTPHPVRHLGGRDWLVDGLWGHRVTDIMVKPDSFPKEGQPWPILNTKWSKVPAVMSFLHFLSGDLLLPIETWKPPEVPPEQLLPFPCSFFCSILHGPHSTGTGGTVSSALPTVGTRLQKAGRASLCDQTSHLSGLSQLFSPENQGFQYKLAFLKKAIVRIN